MRNHTATISTSRRLLAAFVLIVACLAISALPTSPAYADQLVVGEKIRYAGYSTNRFSADGYLAYCAQPEDETPKAGTYTKTRIEDRYTLTRAEETYAILYYCFGGPGFDPDIWPTTWYDGSSMNDEKYFALTHVIISDRLAFSAQAALYGCDSAFCKYWARNFSPDWTPYYCGSYIANDDCFYNRAYRAYLVLDQRTRDAFQRSVYLLVTGPSTQDIFVYGPVDGAFELQKRSARPDITDDNPLYSLEGACYEYFADAACTQKLGEVVTDEHGYALSPDLPIGTYYVRESDTPATYSLDERVYPVTITSGSRTLVNGGTVTDEPLTAAVEFWGIKRDSSYGEVGAQGDGSLAGARYSIRFYAGYFDDAGAAIASGDPLRTWMVTTDEHGALCADEASKYFGDEYYVVDGRVRVPFGTVVIQELSASQGYLVNPEPTMIRIELQEGRTGSDGDELSAGYPDAPILPETIIHGGITIEKLDVETDLATPLGAAMLDGTAFDIENVSEHPVLVDGVLYEPGSIVATIEASGGIAELPADFLPYGTYLITEAATPAGYLLSDFKHTISIRQDGEIIALAGESAARNQVIRGDLSFVKADEETQRRLAGIPFSLTSQTTGECHILVTDENGFSSTESTFIPHTENTNGNDTLIDGRNDSGTPGSALHPSGVWFGLAEDGSVAPVDDALPALPYDTYRLEELPCPANEGLELVDLSITVTRNHFTVDFGTIDNQSRQPEPEPEPDIERPPASEPPSPGTPSESPSSPPLAKTSDQLGKPIAMLAGIAVGAGGLLMGMQIRQKLLRRRRYFERRSPLR